MFHQYFKNASPLNLLIDALLQPEAMNAADLAEFVRLKGFVSEYFPSNNFAPKIAESASLSIQDINRIKLQYAGHICFRFSKN
jgi:hypothetical protein